MRVTEKAKTLLQEKCTRRVPNNTTRTCRLQIRSLYSLSKALTRKPPALKAYLKMELFSQTKADDKRLAKSQCFVFDVSGPLTALLESKLSHQPKSSRTWLTTSKPCGPNCPLRESRNLFFKKPSLPGKVRVGYVQTFEVVASNIRPNLTGTDSAREKIFSGQN